MNFKKLGPIIGIKEKKVEKFTQDGYYCEECEQIFDDETIYDKQRKMFLCQQCKSQAK
jgi:formamidopyrimidine-DNA glycosylase